MSNQLLELTHLEKVLFPHDHYTKGDLIAYYALVAPAILPYLKNRPVMLHRYPNGVEQPGFYQKNVAEHPEWIETIDIEHENRLVHYPLIQNRNELLYFANLGCVDFHPFLSSSAHLKNPDYLILDLDPQDVSFERVIEAAWAIYEMLERSGVKSYCKTSGKRGLHVAIPLDGRVEFEEARNIARALAEKVQAKLPHLISLERKPADRKRKIYIDYLRNAFGQTTVSPYSVRPAAHAPVSTPLLWKEVKVGLDPEKFTIKTVPARLRAYGDLFKPVLQKADLKKLFQTTQEVIMTTMKKTTARKAVAKKKPARKAVAKKTAHKKTAVKKKTVRKTAAKKRVVKKAAKKK